MTDLIEDYLKKFEAELHGDPAWRAEIVGELRSHLHDKAAAYRRSNPDWDEEGIQRAVVRDFGAPKELALAYEPDEGTVVQSRATGEVMLRIPATAARVGQAIGQGTRKAAANTGAFLRSPTMVRIYESLPAFLQAVARGIYRLLATIVDALAYMLKGLTKVVGKALVVLLVLVVVVLTLGTIAGIFLFDDVVAFVESNEYHDVYEEVFRCTDNPCRVDVSQGFTVHDNARALNFHLDGHLLAANNGTATLTVRDPSGALLLERTIGNHTPVPRDVRIEWAPTPGAYHLDVDFEGDFHGVIEVDVWTKGMPRGSLPVPFNPYS